MEFFHYKKARFLGLRYFLLLRNPGIPIQTAVLNGFCQVLDGDFVFACQVSDGSGLMLSGGCPLLSEIKAKE